MPKQIYFPYILLSFVGLAVIGLGAAAAHKEGALSLCLPGLLTGIAMILLSANRLLYLRAADTIIKKEEALSRFMCPVPVGFGLIYMSIDELGDYRLDRWHNSFGDKNETILAAGEKRTGEVFIDPTDHLPVAVKLDGELFLLEGTARKKPLRHRDLTPELNQIQKRPHKFCLGWLICVELIVLLSAAAAYQYARVHDKLSMQAALFFIPAAIFYLFPFIFGSYKRCRQGDINFAINLFAGWTIVGWLLVLYRVWQDIKARRSAQ